MNTKSRILKMERQRQGSAQLTDPFRPRMEIIAEGTTQ
jgi:hypothetical protein